MKESFVYDISKTDYKPVRSDLTNDVFGLSLVPEGYSAFRVVLTGVQPEGEFSLHEDTYHHALYFINGQGTFQFGDTEHTIRPGLVAEIPAEEIHGYKNTGHDNMVLIIINMRFHD